MIYEIKKLDMKRQKNKRTSLFLLGLFISSGILLGSCYSEEKSPDQRFQSVLDKGIEKFKVSGVSAAVVFSKDSSWVGVSGISHDTVSMKPDMLFSIGSVTKNFVAALTLKLVEEGKLSLEDKLSTIYRFWHHHLSTSESYKWYLYVLE